jgi:hypothetical protein
MYTKSIPPSNELIRSKINADLTLKVAITELIANSLGQNARRIDLVLNTKKALWEFIISDDGDGCDDLEQMVMLGHHIVKKRKTLGDIGINGVGFKDAVIWMGDSVRVDSCTLSGKKQMLMADWQDIMAIAQKTQWPFDFDDDSSRATHGVTITVEALRKRRLSMGWKLVPGYITERFSAAIDDGVVITVDGKTVPAAMDPVLEDKTPFKIVRDGRICEGYFGLLVRRNQASSGWNIRYGWQTILSHYTAEGFNNYSAEGFWGMLYMIDGEKKWQLSTHKNNSENIDEMLNSPEMQEKIKPIMEKLKSKNASMVVSASHQLALTAMTDLLTKVKVAQSEDGAEANREKRPPKTEPTDDDESSNNPPVPRVPRPPRRKWKVNALSQTKRALQYANEIQFFPLRDSEKFGKAELTQGGKLLKIYVDIETEAGQKTWKNPTLLVQTSIMLMAAYFGTVTDVRLQLEFPISEALMAQEKIAKIAMYLFQHLDITKLAGNLRAA